MTFIVSPRKPKIITDVRIDSGIETAMIRVLRQLPRKSKLMSTVRHAAMTASQITPLSAAVTNMDYSEAEKMLSDGGSVR